MRKLLAISLLSVALAGCADYPVDQAKKDLGVVTAVRVEAQAQYDAARTPEQKAAALKRLDAAKKTEALVRGVVDTYDTGTVSPDLRNALLGVPYGPEILLVLSGASLLYGDWRKRQAARSATALRQTVAGVEAAKAADPALADALHPALDAAQDEATKVEVAAIRAAFPSAPEPDAPKEIVTK